MSIVVDANVLVVLVSGDPRRDIAQAQIRRWIVDGDGIHAPALVPYEVANGLTRLVAGGYFPPQRVVEAWQVVSSLPITYHELGDDFERVISVALELRRQSAYDAAYIALAQHLGAELWTFDGPLARNAAALNFPVHLLA